MHVITLLCFEWEFILIINCACYSVTYVGNRPLNSGKQSSYHDRVNMFIQLMNYKNDQSKVVYFCQMFDASFRSSPLDPRRHLHMLYIYIATFNCPKGILSLGGKASKFKLKGASFISSMTNFTILSIFRTHAQREYRKV